MTVMRFHSVQVDQLMRTLPGFVFLIGIHRFAENTPDITGALTAISGIGGLAALGACLLAFAALAWIGNRISAARGQL